MNAISKYLTDVHLDWHDSKDAFPKNIYPKRHWPIPFFGNPANALVATVGVNPSSGEFAPNRNWAHVVTTNDWKLRLKNYFSMGTPAHSWFGPWREGLGLLSLSYEAATAAHFDVSYRPTKAMVRNLDTDPREFRHMVERDVAWLFRLLPLCPNLRGLLVFGPVVRHNGSTESLARFVRKSAPRHGFTVLPEGGMSHGLNENASRKFFLHEIVEPGAGSIKEKIIANLTQHGEMLRGRIQSMA